MPTHPSPKPTFCPKWEVSMLAKGRGRWAVSQKRIMIPLMFVTLGTDGLTTWIPVLKNFQNFDMVATQSFLGMLSNPPWCHQSTQRQCYLHNQNKTQAYVGTIRGILLVAYFSIVPLFDSWLCYICNIYLTTLKKDNWPDEMSQALVIFPPFKS